MGININQKLHEAIVLHQVGKFEEAEISYKKAIEFNPNNSEIYNNLGATQQALDKLEDSVRSFKKAIELKPNYHQAFNNLGLLLHQLKKFEEAEISYKKAIEFKPNYYQAYNNLAYTMKFLSRFDEAIINYNKVIELNPIFKKPILERGKILFEMGEFESSLKDFDACNNKDSSVFALRALYALRRIDEVYQRIEKDSELVDENLEVAAFCSFLSIKEKKVTAYKFCNNPMDFIKFSNISSHFTNSNLFINEVIDELHSIRTKKEPIDKSTINGVQSIINIFKNPTEKLNSLKSIILNEIDLYYLKFKRENCTYIKKWPLEKNLYGWHVILKQYGYQNAHIHPAGWLSGVIYLKVVPSFEKNEGAIEFGLSGRDYSDSSLPKFIYQPKEGDIILFPSSLHHKTIPFTSDTDRITISFDLMPNSKKFV